MTSYNKVQLQTQLRISDHIYRYLVILKIKLCSNTNPIHQEVLEDCCLHHLPPEINQKSLHKQEIQSHSNHNFPLYNSTASYISERTALCTFNTLGAEHTDIIFFHRCTAWNYRVHNYVLGAALPAQSRPFSDVNCFLHVYYIPVHTCISMWTIQRLYKTHYLCKDLVQRFQDKFYKASLRST